MKPEPAEREVKKFYEGVSLPAERADAILSMRAILAESRRWKAVAVAASLVAVLLSCVAIGLYVELRAARTVIASLSNSSDDAPQRETPADRPANDVATVPESNRIDRAAFGDQQASPPVYRLVSVTTHGPRCPQCGAATHVLAGLRQQFADGELEFVEVGLNDDASREAHRAMMEHLGLGDLLEGRGESGFFLLTTADGELIERIDPLVGIQQVHDDLAGRLGMR